MVTAHRAGSRVVAPVQIGPVSAKSRRSMAVRERTQAANLVGVTTHDRRQPLPLDARGRRQSSEA